MNIFLSIVIPAYNEENHIAASLRKIVDHFYLKPYSYELIIVNDGCTDNTMEVAKNTLFAMNEKLRNCQPVIRNNGQNRGKGYSVRHGCLVSRGEYVLFTDADLSTPIGEAGKMFVLMDQGFDIVIGSRSLPESRVVVRQNLLRVYMGKTFNVFMRAATGLNYIDTQCGFKCFSRRSVDMIFPHLKLDGFSFDVEILYLAKTLGLKVKDVPIQWFNVKDSRVRVVRDSTAMLAELFTIRRIHRQAPPAAPARPAEKKEVYKKSTV